MFNDYIIIIVIIYSYQSDIRKRTEYKCSQVLVSDTMV